MLDLEFSFLWVEKAQKRRCKMSRDAKMNIKEDSGSSGPVSTRQASAEEEAKLQATIKATQEAEMAQMMATFQKEKALMAIKVDQKDVGWLQKNFDLSQAVAERELRLNGGNLQEAAKALMGSSS